MSNNIQRVISCPQYKKEFVKYLRKGFIPKVKHKFVDPGALTDAILPFVDDAMLAIASSGDVWGEPQMFWHYLTGGGGSIDLSELGHLEYISSQYDQEYKQFLAEQVKYRAIEELGDSGGNPYGVLVEASLTNSYSFSGGIHSYDGAIVSSDFSGVILIEGERKYVEGEVSCSFESEYSSEGADNLRELSALVLEEIYGQLIGYGIFSDAIIESDLASAIDSYVSGQGANYSVTGQWETSLEVEL